MPRPAGVRNHDFEQKRADLVRRLTDYALSSDLRRPALRQFAQALGTSEPTLRHYFGDRSGVVLAVLEEIGQRGQVTWNAVSTPASDLATAIEEYFRLSAAGIQHGGYVRAHAFGIIEGLADEELGQAYLRLVLGPALKAISVKLGRTPGGLPDPDQQGAAAMALFAPLLGLSIHQNLLGGDTSEPIDVTRMLELTQRLLTHGLLAEAEQTVDQPA